MTNKCPVCGQDYHVKPSHSHKRFCCSHACRNELQKTIFKGDKNPNYKGRENKLVRCVVCNIDFKPKSLYSKRSVCSKTCMAKHTSIIAAKKRGNEKPARKKPVNKRPKGINPKTICACGNKKFRKHVLCVECRERNKKIFQGNCVICGIPIRHLTKEIKRKTCKSVKCRKDYKKQISTGPANPNWKGGVKPLHQQIRNHKSYIDWRDSVFKRDKYTCQDCGQVGGNLHAHHIASFSKHPDLRTELSNGKTLCDECHSGYHNNMNFSKKAKMKRSSQLKLQLT